MRHFISEYHPTFETFEQWHGDGLEIEAANLAPGVCMGTYKQAPGPIITLPRRLDFRFYRSPKRLLSEGRKRSR